MHLFYDGRAVSTTAYALQVLYTSTAIPGACPPSPPLPPSQKAALISLQTSTTSSWPLELSAWAYDTDPCSPTWQGITCSGSTVTGVDISYYNLAVSPQCIGGEGHDHSALEQAVYMPVVFCHAFGSRPLLQVVGQNQSNSTWQVCSSTSPATLCIKGTGY